MMRIWAAGILTDPKTFWAYATGASKTAAILAAVHDYPNAFLTPLRGYNDIYVCELRDPRYGLSLAYALKKGCIYIPPLEIDGDVEHVTSKAIQEILVA